MVTSFNAFVSALELQSAPAAFERALGTVMGGWLAFGLEPASGNGVFLGFMALVVGWTGDFGGYAADLKYGIGKLFSQAFTIGKPTFWHV